MAAIEVEAIVAGLSDRFQSHEVLIDGQRRGTVKGGETRCFEVPPGIHTIRLKLDSHSSPAVKLVVGFGKTSVLCQTKGRRRFGLFSSLEPTTQILVREERESLLNEGSGQVRLAHAMAD